MRTFWPSGLSAVVFSAMACATSPPIVHESTPVSVAKVEPAKSKASTAALDEPTRSEKAPTKPDESDNKTPDDRVARIAEALAELEVETIGVLGEGEVPMAILGGGQVPGGVLRTGSGGGGVVRGGRLGGGASAPGSSPPGRITIGTVTVNGGRLPQAQSRVVRLRSDFRTCYRTELRKDPTMEGSLVVEIDLNTSGKVTDVRTAARKGVNLDVAQCIEAVSNRLRAHPTQDATLAFQVTFRK